MDIKKRVFNYVISHGRMEVENAFVVFASWFGVLQSPMIQEPNVAMRIFTACVVLYNLLCIRSGRGQVQPENMGLDVKSVLYGNHLPHRGKSCHGTERYFGRLFQK